MHFFEYEKMVHSLDPYEKESQRLKKEEWAVTEKIHGANFSCHTDGKECRFARRRDFLKDDESFYNFKKADFMDNLPLKVIDIFKRVQEITNDGELFQVIIYGELFGGKYVHPDVPKQKMKAVQIEIQYCPDVRFYGYDIAYLKRDDDGECLKVAEFLDFSDTIKIFEELKIFYAKPLFQGNMNEAINFKIGFDSMIPKQLGLPPLPEGSNKAEGIVVRPLKNVLATSPYGNLERVMVKIKIPEFDETRKQKGNKQKGTVVDNSTRPEKRLIPLMLCYVTENRMVSAVSKIGPPDSEELQLAVEEEFVEDVLTDMLAEEMHNTLWESCNDQQREVVKRCLKGKTHGLMLKYINTMNKES